MLVSKLPQSAEVLRLWLASRVGAAEGVLVLLAKRGPLPPWRPRPRLRRGIVRIEGVECRSRAILAATGDARSGKAGRWCVCVKERGRVVMPCC